MKRVMQTRFGVPGGNCFEAAIASIIEDETLAEVYFGNEGGWYLDCEKWLKERGWEIVYWKAGTGAEPRYAVAGGISPNGNPHAVVWRDGAVVHDPHPRNEGLASIDEWFLVYRNPDTEARPYPTCPTCHQICPEGLTTQGDCSLCVANGHTEARPQ